jgi:hypothetical protein
MERFYADTEPDRNVYACRELLHARFFTTRCATATTAPLRDCGYRGYAVNDAPDASTNRSIGENVGATRHPNGYARVGCGGRCACRQLANWQEPDTFGVIVTITDGSAYR